MKQLYVNNFASALVGGISASAGVLNVASTAGLPTPAAGEFFLLTLIGLDANGNENRWEIVRVTARIGAALTVDRNREGLGAFAWPDGALIEARFTAGSAGNMIQRGEYGLPTDLKYNALPTAATTNNTVDFNDITTPGWFNALLGGAPGSRNPNHPDGQTPMAVGNGVANYYWCLVGRYEGAGGLFQLAIPYLSGSNTTKATLKFRNWGGVWSEWDALMNSGRHLNLGPTKDSALSTLGFPTIGALSGRAGQALLVRPDELGFELGDVTQMMMVEREQLFTSSGVWARPAAMIGNPKITGIGGGGGGTSSSANGTRWGGNGGAWVIDRLVDIGNAQTVEVTIGAGGVPPSMGAGVAGGITSFGPFLSLVGGGVGNEIGGALGTRDTSTAATTGAVGGGTPLGQGGIQFLALVGVGGGGLNLDTSGVRGGNLGGYGIAATGYGAGGCSTASTTGSAPGRPGAPGALLVKWWEVIEV